MTIQEQTIQALEKLLADDIKHLSQYNKGRPMSLSEMEDLVTEIGQSFQEKLLESITQENKNRVSSQKKTANTVSKD